ncbi:NAD(P)H-hydrate dehydratase [Sphingobium sp. AN641]|uniref:NAD(P)H-hydrate dehydratase n=1 Tax=Sphingobium sp. AN641 TaxID=3133443 RepID=UPI0030BC2DC8
MSDPVTIDRAWLDAHPLPTHDGPTDKNARGRVVLVGGAEFVPGGLRLTGEAALRAGAGKLQMATVGAAAMALGVLVPEAAMIALPAGDDGEIALAGAAMLTEAIERCDTLVIGPGMSNGETTAALVAALLGRPREGLSVLLDAAAISGAGTLDTVIAGHRGRTVMTPHHGEMAALTGIAIEAVSAAPNDAALLVARRFDAVVVLKAAQTVIACPDGCLLHYGSDCVGLATGGSGDVLAGVIGGLMARGAAPRTAAAWGVWLHGEAGGLAASRIGPIGFLARELPPLIPALLKDR